MRLYSYVVARDFGFAPNPFHGFCTLATCKPNIRRKAEIGDWIVGTGSKGRKGRLVYAMRVSETMSFHEYWNESRFQRKKPNLRGSKKQAFGDNIYYRGADGQWRQLNSHHSLPTGEPNISNIENDTQADRVLIAGEFTYWGSSGPQIPDLFRNFDGVDICAGRNHKSVFPADLVVAFIDWLQSLQAHGYQGKPLDWANTP